MDDEPKVSASIPIDDETRAMIEADPELFERIFADELRKNMLKMMGINEDGEPFTHTFSVDPDNLPDDMPRHWKNWIQGK